VLIELLIYDLFIYLLRKFCTKYIETKERKQLVLTKYLFIDLLSCLPWLTDWLLTFISAESIFASTLYQALSHTSLTSGCGVLRCRSRNALDEFTTSSTHDHCKALVSAAWQCIDIF